jgi:hypothetical protein
LGFKEMEKMQEIRLTYFFLPYLLHVQSNAGSQNVIVQRTFLFFTYEFIRLPVDLAYQFAGLLELAADNASATPVVVGSIGETNGESVRAFGTAQVKIHLSVRKPNIIRFHLRETVGHRRTVNGCPKISPSEARQFASALRQANS